MLASDKEKRLQSVLNEQELPMRCDLFRVMRITMLMGIMLPFGWSTQYCGSPVMRALLDLAELCVEIFFYFVTLHIWIFYVYTLVLNWHSDDLEFVVSCFIQAVIYFWAFVMKLYFRRIRSKVIVNLIKYLNGRYRTRSDSGFTYVTMKESLAFSSKCCKIYVYSCFVGTFFWLAWPFVSKERILPLACWYPFDYKQPYIYETLYVLQAFGQFEIAAAFSASSGFYMALAIIISGQYDVLYCSLKNLYAGVYIRAGETRETLREMQLTQKNTDAQLDQYYCAKEHSIDLAHLPLPDVRTSMSLALTDSGTSKLLQLKMAFRKCVFHHRYIVGALEQMEKFYSPIWFFKTGEVTFLMCLVVFASVKSTSDASFIKVITLAQYLLLVAWEMLIICYFSEVIAINSQRCGDALLRGPWYLRMREMRLDFAFFIMNSQRTFRLTAGKMYVLNVDRFRLIMTTAFSFLTLLQKMDIRS